MWSGDGVRLAAVLLVGLALAGCQFQPLYAERAAPDGTMRPGPSAQLAAIAVDPPEDRVDQVLRNKLIFLFTGGGDAPPPLYRLRFVTDQDSEALAVEREGNLPSTVLVTLRATFILEEIATGRTLLTGTAFQTASYTFSSQRFANVRGLQDAETRAAEAVAENIATRLAAFFDARAA